MELYVYIDYSLVKESIVSVGANVTPTSIQRVSRCLGPMQSIIESLDTGAHIQKLNVHSRAKADQDIRVVAQELVKQQIFARANEGRVHASFPRFEPLFGNIEHEHLQAWLKRTVKCILQSQ